MGFKKALSTTLCFALASSFLLSKVQAQHAPSFLNYGWNTTPSPLLVPPAPLQSLTQVTLPTVSLMPTTPTTPSNPSPNGTPNPKPSAGGSSNSQNSAGKMSPAKVPEAYACPLFENRPHAELLAAIDSITKEVQATPECQGNITAKSVEENAKTITDSLTALNTVMNTHDPSAVNVAGVDQTMTSAIAAIGNLGNIVNNSSFLNSACGRQSMSTGKVLLGLNEVINGFAPYALLAVSMNAALAPALPFVIGGVVATSGISAIAKMIDKNTLDMTNPDHRKAVLQNTCQYTKVAKKVRFMQLAQSGKIETITKELESSVDLYNTRFGVPSRELTSLLAYKEAKTKVTYAIEQQYVNDRSDLMTIEGQVSGNDDLMVCTLVNELVNWAKDGVTFPSSAFVNLDKIAHQSPRAQKIQVSTLKTVHLTSMKRIQELATKSYADENAMKACAQTGRSWISAVRQSIQMTYDLSIASRKDLESELSQSADYLQWKTQFARIEAQKLTISRVEKAMQELAKDTSIIDRSELAQRMVILKSGLFGSRSSWGFGRPPVLAWIDHTKSMHDQAISALSYNIQQLVKSAFSLTPAGKAEIVKFSATGVMYIDHDAENQSYISSENLATLNSTNIRVGSREQELTCQQLESAWVDWSSAIDHLGAIQFFCDMIDPVLDLKMDSAVLKACRGNVALNGTVYADSMVQAAQKKLVSKKFQKNAALISSIMKELQCPLPAVSDMN